MVEAPPSSPIGIAVAAAVVPHMPRADLADRAAAAAGAADRLEAAAVELAIVERKTCRVETEADSAFAAAADCIDYTAPAAALSADRRFPVEAEMVHTMIQVGFSVHIVPFATDHIVVAVVAVVVAAAAGHIAGRTSKNAAVVVVVAGA